MAAATERKQLWLRVSPELYDRLERARGGVQMAKFCEAALESLFGDQPAMDLGLQKTPVSKSAPAVQVDIGPLLGERLGGLQTLQEETLRAVYELTEYLHGVAPAKNHNAMLMQARDDAQRRLWRLLGLPATPNNGGGS